MGENLRTEELIEKFQFERLLRQDQGGLRIHLLGHIPPSTHQAILTLEHAPFPLSTPQLPTLPSTLTNIRPLGQNSIYHWYLASQTPSTQTPNIKANLIYPCTDAHIKKYSEQRLRVVVEPGWVYRDYVEHWVEGQRGGGRLDWVANVLEGRSETADVLAREGDGMAEEGFVLLPDLNWDRKTLTALHLLALVSRRDISSLRSLRKSHVPWLSALYAKIIAATAALYPGELSRDQLKLYVHYHPTYYHFHIHVVHVDLDAGVTQAVGKAFSVVELIERLREMEGGEERGLRDVTIMYTIGERSGLWEEVWVPLRKKLGEKVGELIGEEGGGGKGEALEA